MSNRITNFFCKESLNHYFTGKWAEPSMMQQRIFTTSITVVVLIGLYCIFADAPFAWLFGDVIIHDLKL